jgi:hypothetical protein
MVVTIALTAISIRDEARRRYVGLVGVKLQKGDLQRYFAERSER